ncbi:MAG: phage tail protein [Betaproteobacteria bacterium]|nr:phage tail protein [Betaproteobacteria bacterium]
MKKPERLRAALTDAMPDLARDPDRLILFVVNGKLRARHTQGSLSYAFTYDLEVLVKDFAGEPAEVFAHLCAWLAREQQELISNPEKQAAGLKFEVEYLTHVTLDILITLALTEDVIVTHDEAGKPVVTYIQEPENEWITGALLELGMPI